jgi:hypothetical protein
LATTIPSREALPHVPELPGSVDDLPLIHPAVDILVPGDDGPGKSLHGGDIVETVFITTWREWRWHGLQP